MAIMVANQAEALRTLRMMGPNVSGLYPASEPRTAVRRVIIVEHESTQDQGEDLSVEWPLFREGVLESSVTVARNVEELFEALARVTVVSRDLVERADDPRRLRVGCSFYQHHASGLAVTIECPLPVFRDALDVPVEQRPLALVAWLEARDTYNTREAAWMAAFLGAVRHEPVADHVTPIPGPTAYEHLLEPDR